MVRLEKEFNSNQLKTKEMRKNVAEGMNLTEKDVEQWLLKRSMVRKQLAEGAENPLKRSAETEANKEAKRGKTDPSIDKVIKTFSFFFENAVQLFSMKFSLSVDFKQTTQTLYL